jgi:hypothetical protein
VGRSDRRDDSRFDEGIVNTRVKISYVGEMCFVTNWNIRMKISMPSLNI